MKTSLTLFVTLIIVLCAFNTIDSKKKETKHTLRNKDGADAGAEPAVVAPKVVVADPTLTYDAYTFNKGSDGGNRLRDMEGYNTPTFVEDIAKESTLNFDAYKKIDTIENSDEKPSLKNYYDGELNLTAARVICGNFKIQKQCNTFTHCGWCGVSKSCIEGNKLGPLQPCQDRKSYLYGKEYYNEVNKDVEEMRAHVDKMK